MDLGLSEEQTQLVSSFGGLLAKRSPTEVVRAAEPRGFDDALWRSLVEVGAVAMAVPEDGGGWGATMVDLALVAEQVGRFVAPAPVVEAQVAARLLAAVGGTAASEALAGVVDGERLVTLAVRPARSGSGSGSGLASLVPAGAVADDAVILAGDRLLLVPLREAVQRRVRNAPSDPALSSDPVTEAASPSSRQVPPDSALPSGAMATRSPSSRQVPADPVLPPSSATAAAPPSPQVLDPAGPGRAASGCRPIANLGSSPLADVTVGDDAVELADGGRAAELYEAAIDEWLTLTAAALVGIGSVAHEITCAYARERHAWGVPIGTFQAVAHPLADSATALDGARLLARKAAWSADGGLPHRTRELAAMAFAFAAETARDATYRGVHFHGGYGFMLEQDVQLYYRRARGWARVWGEPAAAYRRAAQARYPMPGRGREAPEVAVATPTPPHGAAGRGRVEG